MSTKVNSTKINTSPLVKTYTLEEFWQLPDPPDRSKLELIARSLYTSPPPEYTHNDVVARLTRIIIPHLATEGDKGHLHIPRGAICTSQRTFHEPVLSYGSA